MDVRGCCSAALVAALCLSSAAAMVRFNFNAVQKNNPNSQQPNINSRPSDVMRSAPAEEINDMAIIKSCNKTSPISREVMNSVLIFKQLAGTENTGFKCFLHCLYTKYKWMDDVGGFNLKTMQEVLHQTHLQTHAIQWITYKCSAIPSPDKCERAYKFTECFWAETAKFPEESEDNMQSDENYQFY